MRTLSLFSGVGGLDLGLERAGFDVVAQCEADPWCRKVLAKHWPDAVMREDVTALATELSESPDLLGQIECVCGGFPCQDVSVAGKGAGVDAGARSGLWRMMRDAIGTLRPRWVIAENVPALRHRGADRVLGDLEDLGYACGPVVVGASDIGAPHRRQRVFIVSHRLGFKHRSGGPVAVAGAAGRMQAEQEKRERLRADARASGEVGACGMADAERIIGGWAQPWDAERLRCNGHEAGRDQGDRGPRGSRSPDGQLGHPDRDMHSEIGAVQAGHATGSGRDHRWPTGPCRPQAGWEPARLTDLSAEIECGVGGSVDGLPDGLVRAARRINGSRLKAYGNAVCPQVAELIGLAVMQVDAEYSAGQMEEA